MGEWLASGPEVQTGSLFPAVVVGPGSEPTWASDTIVRSQLCDLGQ